MPRGGGDVFRTIPASHLTLPPQAAKLRRIESNKVRNKFAKTFHMAHRFVRPASVATGEHGDAPTAYSLPLLLVVLRVDKVGR